VVLAIGTNDAYATPGREQQFHEAYIALLHRLALLAPKLVVANIPPVDPNEASPQTDEACILSLT
jgi:hypothetical protein